MPRKIAPLTDTQCRGLQYTPANKSTNVLRDGDGLILEAVPSGRKIWRLRYRSPGGKENRATFPIDYPSASLAHARAWRTKLRNQLASGIDPNQAVIAESHARKASALATFGATVDEWLDHKRPDWKPATYEKAQSVIKVVLLPYLKHRPVAEITAGELLRCLQRFEQQEKRHMAHSARTYAGQIFRRSMILGLRSDNPASALAGALKPKNERQMAHLSNPGEIGALLRAMDRYPGSLVVRAGIRLLPLVFVRPGELRSAMWGEFDLDENRWEIPAHRMKMGRPHRVPLSAQALWILQELKEITFRGGLDDLVLPSSRSHHRSISENTFNVAIIAAGFSRNQQTPHGFRHLASTHLHELGWPSRVIEVQLAHRDKNVIRGIYNKAEYWNERLRMMQAWADYLDRLKYETQIPEHNRNQPTAIIEKIARDKQ